MAAIQRRGLTHQSQQNENVLGGKSTKAQHGRTALANISNIQRRPALGKKKEIAPAEKPVNKAINRVKSSSNIRQPALEKNEIFIFKDKIEEGEIQTVSDLAEKIADFDVEDIDADDFANPTLCSEYVKDIYKYMHKLEKRLKPEDYMSNQTEINRKMRSILVDWLIQVQSRFNLLQETLYLTIYIIDRFLSKHNVSRSELQLVGVTAMLIASKYEEMYAPEIGDFVYITDNAYSKQKIRSMEQKMLKACDFDFSNPLCLHFLRRNSKAGSVDAQKHTLAKYLMELTLVDYDMARMLPSQIAAAALYLSIHLIDKKAEWTSTLEHYSGYSESELLPIVGSIAGLVVSVESSKYQAVKGKYKASKFMRISLSPELSGPMVKKFAESASS